MAAAPILHNPAGSELAAANAVVGGRSRHYDVDRFPGTLSIKTTIRGQATWSSSDGSATVDEGCFLVLNHGQTYDLRIRSREPVETFCVFFRPGYVEGIHNALSATPANALDLSPATPFGFFEVLNPFDPELGLAMRRLRHVVRMGELDSWAGDEAFRHVAEALVGAHGEGTRQRETIPLASPATREEVFARLARARQYMLESYANDLDLASVAAIACFSPHHFHSLFQQTFAETPHEFLTRRRMERAQRLLASSACSVEQACFAVGFRSASSFIKLYRRHFGVTPSRHRSHSEDPTI